MVELGRLYVKMATERGRIGYKTDLDRLDNGTGITVERIHETLQIDGAFKPTRDAIKGVIARIRHGRRKRSTHHSTR